MRLEEPLSAAKVSLAASDRPPLSAGQDDMVRTFILGSPLDGGRVCAYMCVHAWG